MRRYTPYEEKILEQRCRQALVFLFKMALSLILLSGMLAMIVSCGSSRKVESSSLNVSERDSSRNEFSLVRDNNIRLTDFVKTDFGIKIEWITYDTSKPVGPDGKPPVLGEGKAELTGSSNDSLSITSEDSTIVVVTAEQGAEREVDMQSSLEKEREDTSLFRDIGDMVTAITVAAVVFLIIRFVRKRTKG